MEEPEPRVTKDNLKELINGAILLRDIDTGVYSVKVDKALGKYVSPLNGLYSLDIARQSAKDIGLPEEYIEKIIAIRFPTFKQQNDDLQRFNSKPAVVSVLSHYQTTILSGLIKAFPENRIVSSCVKAPSSTEYKKINGSWRAISTGDPSSGVYTFDRVIEEKVEYKRWFRKAIVSSKNKFDQLAKLEYHVEVEGNSIPDDGEIVANKFDFILKAHNPIILRSCGDAINNLNEKYKDIIKDFKFIHLYFV